MSSAGSKSTTSLPSPSRTSLSKKAARSARPHLLSARWQQEVVVALLVGALAALGHDLLRGRSRADRVASAATTAGASAGPAAAEVGRSPSSSGPRVGVPLAPGPWGRLRTEELWLSAPRDASRPEDCPKTLWPWLLPGLQQAGLPGLLTTLGVPPDQASALLASARCDAAGCTLKPSAAEREALPAGARAGLYEVLAREPRNAPIFQSFRFRPEQVQPWLRAVELPDSHRARVARLLYPSGRAMVFADQDTLCSQWEEPERAALMRALATTPVEVVTLEVAEGQPVDELAAYYGGAHKAAILPMLTALSRRPGGGTVDIAHLLPPFARERLYSYARRTDPQASCHHAALNFLRDAPEDRFLDERVATAELHAAYRELSADEPRRLGDIITIERPDGYVLHSMAYVAADVAFSKNGRYHYAPWGLYRVADLIALYRGDADTERTYRRKDAP